MLAEVSIYIGKTISTNSIIYNNKDSIHTFGVSLGEVFSCSLSDLVGSPPVNRIGSSGPYFARVEDPFSLLEYTLQGYPLSSCSRIVLTLSFNPLFARYIALRFDIILDMNV